MQRQSRYINRKQATTFFQAVGFAEVIGRPLNLQVTLNLRHTESGPRHTSQVFERLRDSHFTPWLRYRRRRNPDYGPLTHAWSVEAKDNIPHVNWLLHLPDGLRAPFEEKLPSWLSGVAGAIDCRPAAIHTQEIWGPMGVARYCLKGINPNDAEAKFIRPEFQGIVHGKRCGVSVNLGPAARRRHRLEQILAGVQGRREARRAAKGASPFAG